MSNGTGQLWPFPPSSSSVITGTGTLNFPWKSAPNVLDIKGQEATVKEGIETYKTFQDKEKFINDLHPTTKEILVLAHELSTSGKFEDVVKLDKYIREKLFNKEFNNMLNQTEENV